MMELGLTVITTVVALLLGTLWFAFSRTTGSDDKTAVKPGQWFSSDKDKYAGEVYFLGYSAAWIALVMVVVATKVYETFTEWHYMGLGLTCALPAAIVPYFLNVGDKSKPLMERYWVKANIWIWVISYVGNYFWTHYFYNLLGAKYTFPAHRLNNVPICLFFMTHAYFVFYHTGTTILLRRFWTTNLYQTRTATARFLQTCIVVLIMSVITAFMETWTISSFPYYSFKDRGYAYTVGSVCYGIYFIVSFPAFYRVCEDKDTVEQWTWSRTAIDSLGACMLVSILLEWWRLTVGGVFPDSPECVPFM